MRNITMLFILAGFSTPLVHGQGFGPWFNDRIETRIGIRKSTQTETVSLSRGSTSFVDQTSASDLVSTALNFVPLGKLGGTTPAAGSATASLYSLYTLATAQDPLRPSVYRKGSYLRQVFFTLGREETPEDTTQEAGTLAGVKVLAWNAREASRIAQDSALRAELQAVLNAYTVGAFQAQQEVGAFLFRILGAGSLQPDFENSIFASKEEIGRTIGKLTSGQKAQFDGLIDTLIQGPAAAMQSMNALIEKLQRRPQLAFEFQTTQRPGMSNDLYRSQVVFDAGFRGGLFVTINGSFDYTNSKLTGADLRAGRAAGELRKNIVSLGGASLRSPLQLALSGEGRFNNSVWDYRAQLRFVIPISAGINLPLSFGYGNNLEDLRKQENSVYGKFGLTFDFGKIVAALRAQ